MAVEHFSFIFVRAPQKARARQKMRFSAIHLDYSALFCKAKRVLRGCRVPHILNFELADSALLCVPIALCARALLSYCAPQYSFMTPPVDRLHDKAYTLAHHLQNGPKTRALRNRPFRGAPPPLQWKKLHPYSPRGGKICRNKGTEGYFLD